jgi:DNA polymerase-3 subunit alpha
LSAYYLLTKDVIDIAWEVSLIGPSRGSSSGFYTCYLMDIVQMNPIKYNLPHWRHISKERPELPDIDWDSEGAQRAKILELMKEKYGYDNVLNICTFTTEKTKSAVLSACRGLGLDVDVAQGIAQLIPSERGQLWPFEDVVFGNEEKGRKPVKAFIEEIEKYEDLRETIEGIEGLVSGRSVHASGIYIFNDGFVKQNAMMKSTSGTPITQFNMQDSDAMGGLKIDALTINALDRIRKCMDLLLEYGKIEWQGSLRATYNKYLHPDVMELDNPEMFKLLYSGDLINAFQFETNIGQQALGKIKPNNFHEVATANSLMRLAADHGESPLDKFARFKNNIEDWYTEMRLNNLDEDEIKVLETHLNLTYGICDTQESMMEISMDPAVSNFNLTQANKLRKGISKKSAEIIEECRTMFYENNANADIEFLDYVWEYLFKPSFGYSFSKNHTAPYSMILMQEMNMAYRYGIIWWKTACLSVNAGIVGDEGTTTDYGAVAKAVGEMKGVVINPDINIAKLEFTPLEAENKVMFGMKPISGLGANAIQAIMEHRPFASMEDFVERMVVGKLVSEAKAVTLVKAGCFDKLHNITNPKERRQLMIDLIRLLVPAREKIGMVQLPKIIHAVPDEFKKEMHVHEMRGKLFGRNKIPMDKKLEAELLSNGYLKEVDYDFAGDKLNVDQK